MVNNQLGKWWLTSVASITDQRVIYDIILLNGIYFLSILSYMLERNFVKQFV